MCVAEKKPSGLPITWTNLSVSIADKTILHSCSGSVRAGSCLAIMGPSGAGKTTLLNALSRRGPLTAGEVRYGGTPWDAGLRRRVAVVEQEDVVAQQLTVLETLTFASLLRLPARSASERAAGAARVAELISLLKLDGAQHTRVGDATAAESRGISGGERKRLCIALELLPRPQLLFCDEPTSGLDASMALVVATALAALATEQNVTVLASIHQPSSQTFGAFSSLLLLDSGHAVYSGPAQEAAVHFAALGQPCPLGWSHADWLLEVIVGRKLSLDDLVAAASSVASMGDVESGGGRLPAAAVLPRDGDEAVNSFSHELFVLMRRSWRVLRPDLWSKETALMHLGNGVIVGTCWWRIGYSQADLFPRISAIIIVYLFWTFFPLLSAPAIVDEGSVIKLLRKDYAAGAFRLSAWWWATTTVPLLREFIWPAIHVPIFYWMAGINDRPELFVGACALLVLNLLVFNSFGLLIAVLTPKFAMTTLLTIMTFFFTFTGLFVPLERTPFPWLRYLNPCFYVDQIAIQMLVDDRHTYARDGADLYSGGGNATGDRIARPEILDMYGVDTPVASAVAFLAAFVVVCRGGALLLLYRKLRRVLLSLADGDGAKVGREESTSSRMLDDDSAAAAHAATELPAAV